MAEERLEGGYADGAVRVGDTVRRPAGPWTPAVHALLSYLADRGFTGAPRPLGFDEQGREVLTFLEGETVGRRKPRPAWVHAYVATLTEIGSGVLLLLGLLTPLAAAGVPCFGPGREGARLEGSKAFCKEVMIAAGVPLWFLWPGADVMRKADTYRKLSDFLPEAHVEEIPNATHNIFWDQPDAYNEALGRAFTEMYAAVANRA